jgi:serine/threonine protein phosphatase PrpC
LRLNTGDEELLFVAIADGAGSAALSQIGSREAVRHLLSVIPRANLALREVTKDQVRDWMQEVLNHLTTVAERESISLSQLDCTLLLGIIEKSRAVFAQIGDGGWVVEKDGEVVAVTWPQIGQYANITTFITTNGALDSMQFEQLDGKISAIAGFTDGLQMLALDFATLKAHAPFFAPMFTSVRECDDETGLIAPLRGFLASDSVTARTDDDKTLVLACWRDQESDSNGVAQ